MNMRLPEVRPLGCRGAKVGAPIRERSNGYPSAMLELLSLIIGTTRSAVRGRKDLIVENLLLRQQLQVALRPRRRLSLQSRDRLFWVLVRRLFPDWRRYLLYVRPETVIRWHRRGWRW
jgi:putative transposase